MKCIVVYLNLFGLVQAKITDEVTDLVENETNPVTFSCQAFGEPVPTISWYFNSVTINVQNSNVECTKFKCQMYKC